RLPREQVLQIAEVGDAEPGLRLPAAPEPERVRPEVDDEPARMLVMEPAEEAGQALGAGSRDAEVHEVLLAGPGADLRHAARPDRDDPRMAALEKIDLVRRPGLLADDLQRHSSGRPNVIAAARSRNGSTLLGMGPIPCAPAIESSTSAIPFASCMRKKIVAIVTRRNVSATATGPGTRRPSFDSRRWPTRSFPCQRPQARKLKDAPCHRPPI